MPEGIGRREFCGKALGASAAVALGMNSPDTSHEAQPAYSIPKHLPRKLAICVSQWAWFTHSGPGEPYHNLEEVMIGLRERNYNAIRIDTALHLCFRADGSPRGEVAIRPAIPGYSHRFRVVNHKGGHSVDVLKRLIQFMDLVKKYDIYVILSDWEYMHTLWFVESESLRHEILSIPLNQRLMCLAQHMDRLVSILKEKDLADHIAYIEPHNEADISDFLLGAEGRKLLTEAIAFLRDRHPDILVSADLALIDNLLIDNLGTTDNSQVYDHHLYVGKELYEEFFRKTVRRRDFNLDDPWEDEFLKQMLEPNIAPYSAFKDNFPLHPESRVYGNEGWLRNFWVYYNLNIDKFDRWLTEHYHRIKERLKENAAYYYSRHAQEAKRRGLPMVIDEGGFFYGPLYSRFEESEAGLEYYDYLTDLAIINDVWGFAFSTYNCPAMPVWWACPKWVAETNKRFLEGVVKGG
ncbi:cellulase-like family protein [Fervidibacter sacchari]